MGELPLTQLVVLTVATPYTMLDVEYDHDERSKTIQIRLGHHTSCKSRAEIAVACAPDCRGPGLVAKQCSYWLKVTALYRTELKRSGSKSTVYLSGQGARFDN